jgi:hypothetical protein
MLSTEEDRMRLSARRKAYKAAEQGKLVRPDVCSVCFQQCSRIQGHHADYSKPLDVRWVCGSCHRILDRARERSEGKSEPAYSPFLRKLLAAGGELLATGVPDLPTPDYRAVVAVRFKRWKLHRSRFIPVISLVLSCGHVRSGVISTIWRNGISSVSHCGLCHEKNPVFRNLFEKWEAEQ